MPRTLPAGAQAWLAKRAGILSPVVLLDIQTIDGTQYFWSDTEGYYPTRFLDGTRIQSSGGTSTQQYALALGATVAGDVCTVSVVVKNQGANTVIIGTNGNGSDPSATIAPGVTGLVHIKGTSAGFGLQIAFNTSVAGTAWDLVVWNPIATKNGSANLVPLANQNFSGWTVVGGATITLTQNYDVAPLQFYNGWIKSGCSFTCTRDLSTNAGDLILQNLSGNSINRDVSLAVKSHEFEGALAITRLWLPLLDAAIKEFHCYLTEQNMREDEVEFREGQLFDPAQYFVASDIETTECTWRYKSLMCGSTGTATSCNKTLVACQDATRAAQERFNAILTTIANTVNVPPVNLGSRPPKPQIGGGGANTPHPFPAQD